MTDLQPTVPGRLSRLIDDALASKQRGRYDDLLTAFGEVLRTESTNIRAGSVTDVRSTFVVRLRDWGSTPIKVVILKTQPDAQVVESAVKFAMRRSRLIVRRGRPKTEAILIYARSDPNALWMLRTLVEGDEQTLGNLMYAYYPHFHHVTVMREHPSSAAPSAPGVRPEVDFPSWSDRLMKSAERPRELLPDAPYTVDEAVKGLFLKPDTFTRMLAAFERKKNLVLEGPPGVGKTFIAQRLAFALAGARTDSRIDMIQFHPSYAYEDFVRGWRPTAGGLAVRNGRFLRFCERARRDPDERYVFIIDEINRGNLPKIFGDLLMLIERDKRDSAYAIPLTNDTDDGRESEKRFFVPPNVYLLGLMNTADRSLALVDYALRRRFTFIELEPAFDTDGFVALLRTHGADAALTERIQREIADVNAMIERSRELGSGFMIGHSYFCPTADDGPVDPAWYSSILDTEVVPLLREYWADNRPMLKQCLTILGKDDSA